MRLAREVRRLSEDHVDGVARAWRRADAIDANLKFRKPQKQTPSQRRFFPDSCSFLLCSRISQASLSKSFKSKDLPRAS